MYSVWWLTRIRSHVDKCGQELLTCIADVLQGPTAARVTPAALEGGHLVHLTTCRAVQVCHVAGLMLCTAAVALGAFEFSHCSGVGCQARLGDI